MQRPAELGPPFGSAVIGPVPPYWLRCAPVSVREPAIDPKTVAPKIFAATHPESVALNCALVYRLLLWATWPIIWLANNAARGFLRVFGVRRAGSASQALSADELRTATRTDPALPADLRLLQALAAHLEWIDAHAVA